MAELGRRSVLNAPHGTLAGYRMGCGCLWCHAACQAHLEPIGPAVKHDEQKIPTPQQRPRSVHPTANRLHHS